MDELEAELRRKLHASDGAIRSVVDAHAQPGGEISRSALREAVQRRESARHELERYVRRAATGARWAR